MRLQVLSLGLFLSCGICCNDFVLNDEIPVEELAMPENQKLSQLDAVMPSTLDTLGEDDSGNWVLKRVWWEKAETAFGKIMALNLQISQQQMEYFGLRNEVDKLLDADKRALILKLDQLEQVINYLLGLINKNDNLTEADLQKNSFKGSILENEAHLLKLKDDISQLNKLDSELDDAIIKVIDQVQKCNDYEALAWEDFKKIGRVLNDELAKNLYYQVANYRKNIKINLRYLKTDLRKSFEVLTVKTLGTLDEIKKMVVQLRDSGIDLVYESKMMHESSVNTPIDEEPAPVKKQSKKNGFFGKILNAFKMLGNLLLWLPKKLLNLFGWKF